MNEITNSIAEVIKKRTASVTFGTYLFFWIAYHWQGVYVTLFVEQELVYQKYRMLKNEYVDRYFFGYHGVIDLYYIFGLLIPALLTWIFIWLVPHYILIHFYRQEQKFKVDKRIIKIEEEKRIQVERQELAQTKEQTIEAETKVSVAKKEAAKADPSILWNHEFYKISPREKMHLRDILESVYEHSGKVRIPTDLLEGVEGFTLDPNALRYGDGKGLLKITNSGGRIELTDKGKYFAGKYDKDI